MRKDFIDDLNELPEQFTINMENQRDARYHDLLPVICKELDLVSSLDELNDEERMNIIDVFERFFSYGYYSGIQFTLHCDEEYEHLEKLPNTKKS